MRTPRWRSISCFNNGDSGKRPAYLDRPLLPLAGMPLVVFKKQHCTKHKVELVMKVEMGRSSFDVQTVGGDLLYSVGRRSLQNWSRRFIRDAEGKAICCVERVAKRNPPVQEVHILSLEGPEPCVVVEARKAKTSLSKKEDLKATIKDIDQTRCFLQFTGDLKNRIYGASWSDTPRGSGHMVAMAWSVSSGLPECRSQEQYVLELPAGVDQALIVALAVALEEMEAPPMPPSCLPLEPLQSLSSGAFGKHFVTKTDDVFVLAMAAEHLSVIDSTGMPMLTCSDDGMFKSMEDKPVFQLTEGGFRAQGTTMSNKPVDVSFLELVGDESSLRVALECSSVSAKGCNALLVANLKLGDPCVPIRLINTGRARRGLDPKKRRQMESAGSVVARAVLGSLCPKSFEEWYYDATDQLSDSRGPNDKSMDHVGIGVEVAAGVDVALIFAFMLITIKFLPAAFACETTSGSIRARGVHRMPMEDNRDKLYDKSVTTLLERYGLHSNETDFLLSSHREEMQSMTLEGLEGDSATF
ncbi:hypothetical protein BSKO_11411 [Bryopsis sp. KO-2023]|nr:hypothetical protein BSKO_11411 [Bryopsis sp. KO-2023]